ncbi:SIS domain-containing protein [Blastopirellula marina]|uniref:KpsF/GutQ family sugar-phosphate isomerase n=1 Tax=Blastopirellula marina TaxID=124 RepID=A0A2S8GPP3_9BACT|nr:KpsF/GutQ family sugar-phosphate isomerase [Blastopirellula marina]PQO46397.1 KpsF/GutQ family sugar-phosphate isomerase [Blastopirellula marina]
MSLPIRQEETVSPRSRWIVQGQATIRHEAEVMLRVAHALDDRFADAVEMILDCPGDIVVSGIGKAGHVGKKLAATFASTGTRSHFLHPAEAIHGDLGRVGEQDIVLMLSQSGETEEVVKLLPVLRGLGAPIIAITSSPTNSLGKAARVVLELGGITEACPLNLAPTASTAAMLAMGDALALTVSQHRGFRAEDFARYHPGGSLGRRLALVEEKMRPLDQCRVASDQLSIRDVFRKVRVAGRRTGAVMLVDDQGRLSGIFTDSDLARLFERDELVDIEQPISSVMTTCPKTTTIGTRYQAAMHRLADDKISELPVIDENGCPLGMLDVTDMVGHTPADSPSDEDSAGPPTLKFRFPNQAEQGT